VSHFVRRVLPFLRVKTVLHTLIPHHWSAAGAGRLIGGKRCLGRNRYAAELEDAVGYRKPMEVKEVVFFPHADGEYARCPRCQITMEREYVRYCDRCGQCLDWDGYDDALVVLNTGVKRDYNVAGIVL